MFLVEYLLPPRNLKVSPIIAAVCGGGKKELIDQLVAAGDDPHFVCSDGSNALCFASNSETIAQVLNYKLNPNPKLHENKGSPLNNAVCWKHVQSVRLLLENRALPNHVFIDVFTKRDSTILFTAISDIDNENDNCEIIELLLLYGADSMVKNVFENTPLEEYMKSKVHKHSPSIVLKITRLFIQAGVKINFRLKGDFDRYFKSYPYASDEPRQLVEANTSSCIIA